MYKNLVFCTILLFLTAKSNCQEVSINDLIVKSTIQNSGEFFVFYKNDDKPFSGIAIETNENLLIKYEYKLGKLNGSCLKFKNQILIEDFKYLNNHKNGISMQYYDDGSMKTKGQFKDDLEVGLHETYYQNGKIKIRGNFNKGFREGEWVYFDDSGFVFKKESYSESNLIKSVSYKKGGGLDSALSISNLEIREFNGRKKYFQKITFQPFSGFVFENIDDSIMKDLRKEFRLFEGIPRGPWTIFFNDSIVQAKGSFDENGLMNGDYIDYFITGQIKTKGEYKNDKKNGSWTFYDKDGNYVIGTFLEDMKHSVWRYFDKNGKHMKDELYIFDVKQD